MFKILFIILGSVAGVGVLAAGGVAAGFATGVLKVPEVVEVRNAWGEVTPETTEVVTSIVLDNPNSISLGLDNIGLAANVFLNDILVAEGGTQGVRLPQGESTTELLTRIDNTRIARWWPTHITNAERTTVRIAPYGNARFLNWSFDVPGPGFSDEFDTDLLEGANSDTPESFPLVAGYTVTVQSREFRWGTVTEETTNVTGTVVIRNDSPIPIAVSRIRFQFTMNGITVGEGSTEEVTVLPPGQDTPVPMEFSITNGRLIVWWPTHVTSDERTLYSVQVNGVFEIPLIGASFELALVRFQDEFETDIMGRRR